MTDEVEEAVSLTLSLRSQDVLVEDVDWLIVLQYNTMGDGSLISTWYTAGLTAWQTIKLRLAGEECEDQASLRSNIRTYPAENKM